jgi:hypothetical protein
MGGQREKTSAMDFSRGVEMSLADMDKTLIE